MHRALGGAPALSAQWRSLGRSLPANAARVRRGSPLYNNKKIHGRGVRPRFSQLLQPKNKIFIGKKLGRFPLYNKKRARVAGCPASCGQCVKTRWGGRGAGTPAPQLRLAPAKFGAGKFCRFKEQKRKFLRRK
jgi:hypothetical protein